MARNDGGPHVWSFFRAGGFDHVRLGSGEDVAALAELDQKLWVALACPTRGIEFDERTLDLIDSDRDGRIRAPEILAAARWATGLLRDLDGLAKGRDTLALAAINDAVEEGRELRASAAAILRMLGKGDASEISLQDAADSERIFNATAFNGDGIIPPDAAEDAEMRAAIEEVIGCVGAETDRSGKPGLSAAKAARFFDEAAQYAAWHREAETATDSVLPLGAATESGAALLRELGPKLDDYFTRNRLAAFDPTAGEVLNPPRALYEALAAQNLSPDRPEMRALPLAHIGADAALPLDQALNPAFAEPIARLRREIVGPLIGDRTRLSEQDWTAIKERFERYDAWWARRPGTAAAALGIERTRRLLELKPRIDELLARDGSLERETNAIARVEKLLRLQRDLLALLNNTVSFRDFYTRAEKAAFQAGTLYIDGRSCELCVAVADEAKHAALATLSRIYLVYCSCTRLGSTERMTIAAAVTAGDADNLLIGRNGVFYDRKGRDWDATIVKIVEHPISLRQAFWLPYRQAARVIGEQVQKFAAARAAASRAQMVTTSVAPPAAAAPATAAAPAEAAAAPARDQTYDAARFAGIFAAIGLALGAIGTAVASVVTGFLNLSWWQMPLAVLGLILAISGPSVLIAALKLRSRNLGPILDACGWAVNTRLRINIPFGTALTALARLPERANRSLLADPYADKRRPWALYAALAIALALLVAAWRLGLFGRWL